MGYVASRHGSSMSVFVLYGLFFPRKIICAFYIRPFWRPCMNCVVSLHATGMCRFELYSLAISAG